MKKQSSSTTIILILVVIIILLLSVGYFLFFRSDGLRPEQQASPKSTTVTSETAEPGKNDFLPINTEIIDRTFTATEVVFEKSDLTIEGELLNNPKSTEPLKVVHAEKQIEISTRNLNNFFSYLDKQDYVQVLNLPSDTKTTFTTLLNKLVNDPPVITGESDDLFTLLKNTAHFFRVLGEDNINLLKEIIVHEHQKLEALAEDLFIVLGNSEKLVENYNINLKENTLYEYSSFLMNTMGGRLYMFRRDMELRMIISYYSLLFVDQAEKDGLNQHGIDILPFVATLIKEIENHGQKLQMRDKYLERLYQIEQRLNQ